MPTLHRFIATTVMPFLLLGAASDVALGASAVCADKFIRMVIPQPAGGVGDLIARLLGDKVSTSLGQQIVMENRPGATTTIGASAVATSKPDGCTLLALTVSTVVASVMRSDLSYDLGRDLVPVAGVGSFPMALAVPATSKITTFSEFVAATKLSDGLNYGSGGPGTLAHLASVRLLKEVGGRGTHVPYKGNAYAIQGLLGGDVQFMFPTTAEAIQLTQSGKLRVLGVTSDKRVSSLPAVATMKELGFTDFTPQVWYAFMVRSGTSSETVARLHAEFAKAVSDPTVQARLVSLGFSPQEQSPKEVATLIQAESVRWKKVVVENNITAQD